MEFFKKYFKILRQMPSAARRKLPGAVVLAHMQRREHRTNMRV